MKPPRLPFELTHPARVTRRQTLLGLGALATTLASGSVLAAPASTTEPLTVRIGYQKSSTLTVLLKAQGSLEKQLAPLGVKPSWHEFTSGLPLLEALNLNHLDVSADVADTVPVFAQAAGAELTFVAREAPSPTAQAIIVKADSPIQTLADLKGKKIGFTKAAGAHYLLYAALQKVGLSLKDIQPAYLSPADGRAAFGSGALDAWVVWDPFLSAAQRQSRVRTLADGSGIAAYQRYYLARSAFADSRGDVLNILYLALKNAGDWVKQHPREAAELLAPLWGLDTATVEQANGRRSYAVQPVLASGLAEQQKIADAFLAEKLLPRRVDALKVALFKPVG